MRRLGILNGFRHPRTAEVRRHSLFWPRASACREKRSLQGCSSLQMAARLHPLPDRAAGKSGPSHCWEPSSSGAICPNARAVRTSPSQGCRRTRNPEPTRSPNSPPLCTMTAVHALCFAEASQWRSPGQMSGHPPEWEPKPIVSRCCLGRVLRVPALEKSRRKARKPDLTKPFKWCRRASYGVSREKNLAAQCPCIPTKRKTLPPDLPTTWFPTQVLRTEDGVSTLNSGK